MNVWRRSIESGQFRKRLLLAFFVGAGTFLLAHGVNGVVGDTLMAPVDRFTAAESASRAYPDSQSLRKANHAHVQDIMSSGLFPVPTPAQIAAARRGGAGAVAAAPLNAATKISLIGIVGGGQGAARAILEELPSKKQGLYRVSQRVPDVGELAAIEKDRVLFRDGEQEEWLELAIMQPAPGAGMPTQAALPVGNTPPGRLASQPVSTRRIIPRAQLAEFAANPQAYLTEARFQPHFGGNGALEGFKVDGIRQVGLLEKAGLQNQDILSSINGVEIRDPGKLWEIFKQLQQERTVRLNVVRNNQPLTLLLDVRG